MPPELCYLVLEHNHEEAVMASGATPHFHNSMGVPKIEIGASEFMCIGAKPPHDHPHVFLDMGASHEIVCPYCSTHYVLNAKLHGDDSTPAGAAWHQEAA
jgi:uncharacterized Zn-finger protein